MEQLKFTTCLYPTTAYNAMTVVKILSSSCIFLSVSIFLVGCLEASVLDEQRVGMKTIEEHPIVWSAGTRLSPANDEWGNGFAEAKYDEETFEVSVRANLMPKPDGHYVAWLIRDVPTNEVVLLGTMDNKTGNGSYSLIYKLLNDYRNHQKIIITWEEENDEDAMPSDTILEGKLQVL